MARSPYFDILFEPVKIGPVTTKNRFYQVPHATGMGYRMPNTLAAMRGMKAEGGWGVVSTEYCSIHPTSEDIPYPHACIWDEEDIKANALMAEKVHEHGSLAAMELWHGGHQVANLYSRETPLAAYSRPAVFNDPVQSSILGKSDIKKIRQWYVAAAKRAKTADFDIIYVYATHNYLIAPFLSSKANNRTDEYGGSAENRVRLLRELIEETKNAVGDKCAVAVRFCADDGSGVDGLAQVEEQKEVLGLIADLPDLWDISISDWTYEMGSSRFVKEGALENYVSYVKSITSKPVVSVGRFTSPNTMVSQVKRGIVDLIGAARPSIADPFLPKKIEEGREEDIRECIGCNICFAHDNRGAPLLCTQNPTMGEEWRREWHPEKISAKKSDDTILIVGAGPAGMEAAVSLGKRGYHVYLADTERELGGRVAKESKLPTLSEWNRVAEYRSIQLEKLSNVETYPGSNLTIEDILEFKFPHVVLATGSLWRYDDFGLINAHPMAKLTAKEKIFTSDDIIKGRIPTGRVLIFDDDHYYMGSVIAEKLVDSGCQVDFVSTYSDVSDWAKNTAEQHRIQARLINLGVNIIPSKNLKAFDGSRVILECIFTGREEEIQAEGLVMVTARIPNDELYHELASQPDALSDAGIKSLTRIGDCLAPSTIARSVFSGHKFAREFDEPVLEDVPFKREKFILGI
jgi:dimethylamine/trimethylamine dehydrogenase